MEHVTEVVETATLDLGALLDAGDGATVTIVAGETRLAAHRAVLVARSPVFEAMLRHDAPQASSGQVTITDVEGPVLRQLISYLYTLQASQQPSMVLQLLPAAEKYGVSELKAECERTQESSSMEPVIEADETAASDLGAVLDAGNGAWVTLVAGETRLAVHRAVLAVRSPVFRAMVHPDTLEASSGEITLSDMDGQVLRQLISFFYTLEAPQLPSMAEQLLAAADKYGVTRLKAECEQHLAAQLAVETAAAIAVLAVRHSCLSLTAATLAFINANHEVLATDGWADAVFDHPRDVVEVSRMLGELSEFRNLSGEEKVRRLIQVAQNGAAEDLQALLDAGADVGARDGGVLAQTALHYAAARGRTEAVKILVEGEAEVDARDVWQETPLHKAACNGHTAVMRLLLASSADPNASNCCGSTPLHFTAYRGHAEAAAALLEAGADRRASDKDEKTPQNYAEYNNHKQLIEMLR